MPAARRDEIWLVRNLGVLDFATLEQVEVAVKNWLGLH